MRIQNNCSQCGVEANKFEDLCGGVKKKSV